MALFVSLLLERVGVQPNVTLYVVVAIVIAAVCWQAAYRGVQVSAILMLVLEAISVAIHSDAGRHRALSPRGPSSRSDPTDDQGRLSELGLGDHDPRSLASSVLKARRPSAPRRSVRS